MTLKMLLLYSHTIDPDKILERADTLFRGKAGRYYSGELTDMDVKFLTDKENDRVKKV